MNMRECTYGWYPSAEDVYLKKNDPSSENFATLYKFKNTDFYNAPFANPMSSLVVRGISSMSAKSSSLNTRPKSQCHRSLRLNKKSNNGMLFSARNSRIPTPSWSNGSDKIKSETFVDDKVSQLQRRPHDLPTDAVFQEHGHALNWPRQQILKKYDKPFTISQLSDDEFSVNNPMQEKNLNINLDYIFTSREPVVRKTVVNDISQNRTAINHLSTLDDNALSTNGHADSFQENDLNNGTHDVDVKFRENFEKHKLKSSTGDTSTQKLQNGSEINHQLTVLMTSTHTESPTYGPSPSVEKYHVKSATANRNKRHFSQRPVYSARPSKSESLKTQVKKGILSSEYAMFRGATSLQSQLFRPTNPAPPRVIDCDCYDGRSPSPTYQEIIDKYGWRSQVHGDPYNIKKITKRYPYTVPCDAPSLAPEPPKFHSENKETFFINTIPCRRSTFVIHPNWASELLHTRKIELQQRDRPNYTFKTFSFVY